MSPGLGKIPTSPWLTLLHICGVIPTLQLPETPCWYCRKLRVSADVTFAKRWCCRTDRRCLCLTASSADIVASNGECFMMFHHVLRVFHNVLLVVHNVLWVFHDVSQCFTVFLEVLLCFMMFSEPHNDRHQRPRVCRSSQESRQHCRDRRYCHESDPMLNSVLNGDWSNSVSGWQLEKGHISRMCNSVTHLLSYTNTAIAGNSTPGADIAA